MSIFENAKNVQIQDGVFIVTTGGRSEQYTPMKVLVEHAALGALHNANERFDPPKCHPDTRVALLDSIRAWLRDPSRKPVMWLSGPAGAGKSAIMQTLAEDWEEEDKLAAAFFFSRTAAGRNVKTPLVATIAYQLASAVPGTRRHIEFAVLNDMGLFKKNLRAQITSLIIRPLNGAIKSSSICPMVIIIDGLDECASEDAHREILETIGFVSQRSLPISFLVASRPERQIRESFANAPLNEMTCRVVLDDSQNPDRDIELFLQYRFAEIRRNHHIDESWPTQDTIDLLVEKASGQFIYASTVVKYVGTPRKDPRRSLEVILGLKGSAGLNDRPFKDLDALYTFILDSVAEESYKIVMTVLSIFIFLPKIVPQVFWTTDPSALDTLLLLDDGQIYYHLTDMHSLLEIPPFRERSQHTIHITHASFSDFITDTTRSGIHYLAETAVHICLTKLFLSLLFVEMSGNRNNLISPKALTLGLGRCLPLSPADPLLKQELEVALGENVRTYRKYVTSLDLGSNALPQIKRAVDCLDKGEKDNCMKSIRDYLARCDTLNGKNLNTTRNNHTLGNHSQRRSGGRFTRWIKSAMDRWNRYFPL